jgi:hypothetical protein
MEKISQVILNLREEYIKDNFVTKYINEKIVYVIVSDYIGINNGLCTGFAEEVDSIIKNCDIISNDFLVQDIDSGWDGNGGDEWDIDALLKYNSPPPDSLTLENIKEKVLGYHCWIYYENKHYDAECPFGVTNLFELPFFERSLNQGSNKTLDKEALNANI